MSGGSFDYLFGKVRNMGLEISEIKSKEEIEFGKFLIKVSSLMQSIEWAYSGDTSIEDFKQDWNKFKEENLK